MTTQTIAAVYPTCRRRSRTGPSRQAVTPVRSRAALMLIRISQRVLESRSSVLLFTICSRFTVSLSSGWAFQIAPASFALFSSDIGFLLEKTAGKDILDPVNLHPDIGGRKPRNLRDGNRVHVLQMGNHDLPVQRFELPDELRELL